MSPEQRIIQLERMVLFLLGESGMHRSEDDQSLDIYSLEADMRTTIADHHHFTLIEPSVLNAMTINELTKLALEARRYGNIGRVEQIIRRMDQL